MKIALALLLLCLPAGLSAAGPVFPDRGRAAVVDAAGVIPDEAEAALDARIVAWNRATGHQLAVATIPDLQGYPIQDYGYRLLRHWGLGRKGIDDGVILLLAPGERKVRIEVGYGLEPVLTDALSSAIVNQTVRPALQKGDVAGALAAGADRIMQAAASSEFAATPEEKPFPWLKTLLILAGAGLIILFLWPLFESWYLIWPFTRFFPDRAKRGAEKHAAREAERKARARAESNLTRAERAQLRKSHRKTGRDAPAHAAASGAHDDPLERLRDRADRDSDSSSSHAGYDDSASSSDSGFDSGGGSAGGGGADGDY